MRRERPLGHRRAVTLAALGASLLLGACSTGNDDPRALPGTDSEESLKKVAQSFRLQLPSCEVEKLGWPGRSDGWGSRLALRFRAPEDCVNGYLTSNGVHLDEGRAWPYGEMVVDGETLSPTRAPFREEDMERFALTLDPQAEYPVYEFRTSNGALIEALVDPRGKRQTVYLASVSGPGD